MSRKHYRWNYWSIATEGGLYIGGMNFINANTVLPTMATNYGAPAWLVSLIPALTILGFILPNLFTAHIVDRLPKYMPLLRLTGVFQRLPFLLTACILYLFADAHPVLGYTSVFICLLFAGLAGGITLTAWQQLIAKLIPGNRLASMTALRSIVTAGIGILAGTCVKIILENYPGSSGYALLHLITFAFLLVSYIVFWHIREGEDDNPPVREHVGFLTSMSRLPGLLRDNKPVALYMLSKMFNSGYFIIAPFLGIYALKVTGLPESQLGIFVAYEMTGALCGNVVAGYLGDKYGNKFPAILSRLILFALTLFLLFAQSESEFNFIYFAFGFSFFIAQVASNCLTLEILPQNNRSSYLAMLNTVNLPVLIGTPLLASQAWSMSQDFKIIAVMNFAFLSISLFALLLIKDPRHAQSQSKSTDLS